MTSPNDFDALAQLLPFYVNGTLDPADCAQIDAGLATSPQLRAALADEEILSGQFKAGGKRIMVGSTDPETRLATVLSHLPNQEPPVVKTEQSHAPVPVRQSFLAFLNPAHWHPSVSLALALAVVIQAGWIASSLKAPGETGYITVSGPDVRPLGDAPTLIVRPRDGASWSAVETALADAEVSIVSGPAEGRLTVRADAPNADLKATAQRLRASPDIAFVGQVQ